jgi:hypothetical protein
MEPKVTLIRVRDNDGKPWDSSFVEVNGIKRGIIRQDNSGGWAAEMMGCYKTTNAANVFGYFATQQRAIDAIVKATANYPAHIIYPPQHFNVRANWNALGVSA